MPLPFKENYFLKATLLFMFVHRIHIYLCIIASAMLFSISTKGVYAFILISLKLIIFKATLLLAVFPLDGKECEAVQASQSWGSNLLLLYAKYHTASDL